MWDWMEWMDTPQTVMTTRAPAVLKTEHDSINIERLFSIIIKPHVLTLAPCPEKKNIGNTEHGSMIIELLFRINIIIKQPLSQGARQTEKLWELSNKKT